MLAVAKVMSHLVLAAICLLAAVTGGALMLVSPLFGIGLIFGGAGVRLLVEHRHGPRLP